MGIFLNLTAYPQRIPEDQWERTYKEALRIVDRSDFLDRVFLERNGRQYAAARKTAERDFPEDGPGICVCGTMTSGFDMEEFYLFRRKPRCRDTDKPDNGADILFEDWYPEDSDIPTPTGAHWIWGAKTQGRPGHIPLLSIACLFADCFPETVRIGGDITACTDPLGMDAAVEGDEESPHEIEVLMGRVFFAMSAGHNRNLPVYLPLDTIRVACHQVFPNTDTDALIDRLLAKPAEDERQKQVYGDDDTALINQLEKKAEDHWKQVSAYDLREPNDLRRWCSGLTIEPHLENSLLEIMKQIKAFSVERENYFIRHNRYVLIYENVWEYIFNRIMDNQYIYRFFLLFSVDCSHKTIHDIMSSLLANPPLIDMLWERTEKEPIEIEQ